MKVTPLFPTLVCEFEYEQHEEFKEVFFNVVKDLVDPSGEQHEGSGAELQQIQEFLPFYTFVAQCAKRYVAQLGVDPDEWSYNIVKSWWNAHDKDVIEAHDHCDAHLSFAYYVNAPPYSSHLIFFPGEHFSNDLIGGLFSEDYNNSSPIVQENAFNSSPAFPPVQGKLIMFPASLKHTTVPMFFRPTAPDIPTTDIDVIKTQRVGLAGDFLLTMRDTNRNRPLGLRPMEKWIRFN